MSKVTIRLTAAQDVTARAVRRILLSLSSDRVELERAIATGDGATIDDLRALDAFVQRFEQLFEHVVQRLLPAIYRAVEYDDRPPPPRNLLKYAEEAEIIASARTWADRAELRNRLVHEYPVDADERARDLTAALQHAESMIADVEAILAYAAGLNTQGL